MALPREELADNDVNGSKPEPVAAIDQGSPSLKLFHKIAKIVRLVWVVEALNTALGDDAAAIRLLGGATSVHRHPSDRESNGFKVCSCKELLLPYTCAA